MNPRVIPTFLVVCVAAGLWVFKDPLTDMWSGTVKLEWLGLLAMVFMQVLSAFALVIVLYGRQARNFRGATSELILIGAGLETAVVLAAWIRYLAG